MCLVLSLLCSLFKCLSQYLIMKSLMRHFFISYLFLGFFLLSFSSVHAQASWQFYGGNEVYNSGWFNNLQQYSIGTECQIPLGNRIFLGTGVAANMNNRSRLILRFNNIDGFPSSFLSDSQSFDSFDEFEPIASTASSFSFIPRAHSIIRLDVPLYIGVRLGKESTLPFLLKVGTSNEFARSLSLSSSGMRPDGIHYGLSSYAGIQIPFFRGKEIGFSMEPYFTFGRNIDIHFLSLWNSNAQVHSFGLRFSTHIL